MPKLIKPVNEFTTYVAFPSVELVEDHQKRYYGVPKGYRMSENPQEGDPGYCYLGDVDDQDEEVKAFLEALQLMSKWYWKILADDAEKTYRINKP